MKHRKWTVLPITFCALVFSIIIAFGLLRRPSMGISNARSSTLGCVKIAETGQTNEGIGALFRRNQIAVFIAESYHAKIAFPNITSDHGYAVQDMFDQCPTPPESCTVHMEKLILYRCPRADCECLKRQLQRYIAEKGKVCRVLGVETDRVRTLEYSGCVGRILSRYFGTTSKPSRSYDAIHYRTGDLAEKRTGKKFSLHELWYLLSAMCKISERDIIVVTEGRPKIPKPAHCGNRLVLASDTTVHEAFRILQHAMTVAVGTSSFATMMMEVASPKHMVVLARVVAHYQWVDCEYWTVVGDRGALFHFDSKKMMLGSVLGSGGVQTRSLRTRNQERFNKYEVGVPPREWNPKEMWKSGAPGVP